jgi:type I restriction enzyme S subunit
MIETNFKHTDIGVIPHDWEVKTLGDIGSIRMCKRIMKHQTSDTGDIPFYKIGTFGKVADAYISQELYKEFRKKYNFPKKGDILLSAAGTIGRTVVYDGKPAYFQDSNIVWIENNKQFVINELLYYLYHRVNWITDTGTIPRIYNGNVGSILIPLPPTLAEQEKIANALSKIDQLINDLGALIEKKKAIKQGTMQDLLTAKCRLKGFTGEWNSVKLGDMCYFGKGKGLKKEYLTDNGRYKCILYGEIFTKYDSIIKSVVSRTNIEEGTYSQKGDVLMPGSTTTLGIDLVKAVVINENDVLLGGDVIILRPKENQISSEFLAYLISNIDRNKVADVTQGITIIHLHAKNMTDIAYLIPPTLAEQDAIANILSSMDTEITNLEQKRDKYIAIKQGMMQNLLTGKIRLI